MIAKIPNLVKEQQIFEMRPANHKNYQNDDCQTKGAVMTIKSFYKQWLFLLSGLIALMFVAVDAFPARDYPMSCRGPLNYITGTGGETTVIFIKKNNRKAGPNGTWLAPGTCAWHDRQIANTEPTRIFWREIKGRMVQWSRSKKHYLIYYSPSHNAMVHCAGDINCVITFRIHNVGDKHYESNSPESVSVQYPFTGSTDNMTKNRLRMKRKN